MNHSCRDCGAACVNLYCARCIDEDCASIDAWECQQVERCDREFDDGAYEQTQIKREQRYLENDANWR